MSRIVVLGCAGSGKSTFARRLGERTRAPVICLDAIWQPTWGDDDVANFRTLVAQAHAGDAWISDGNFAVATFDIRLPRATLIVWMDRSRIICAWRSIARVLRPGEAHRVGGLVKVMQFIWGFEQKNRPLIEAQRIAHGPNVPVVRLKNDREIGAFLDSAEGD